MPKDDFSLIVRFARESDESDRRQLDGVLSYFSPAEMLGMSVYEQTGESIDGYPIPYHLVALKNTSLKNARRLYQKFLCNAGLMREILFARGFPQHNEIFGGAAAPQCLGTVSPQGALVPEEPGEETALRFFGKEDGPPKTPKPAYVFFEETEPVDREKVQSLYPERTPVFVPVSADLSRNLMRFAFSIGAKRLETENATGYFMYDNRVIVVPKSAADTAELLLPFVQKGKYSFLLPSEFVPKDIIGQTATENAALFADFGALIGMYPLLRKRIGVIRENGLMTRAASDIFRKNSVSVDGVKII